MSMQFFFRRIIREELYDGCLKILERGKRMGHLCGKKVVNEDVHYCKKHSRIVSSKEIPDIIRLPAEIEIQDVYED